MAPDNHNLMDELRLPESGAVEYLYSKFRKRSSRAVEAAGGSHADGNTFFRIAVIQTCMLANQNMLPESTDFDTFLSALSTAHFRDWASERNQYTDTAGITPNELIPDAASRAHLRRLVRARRQWQKLDEKCRHEVATAAALEVNFKDSACLGIYLKSVPELLPPDDKASLPPDARMALTNPLFKRVCDMVDQQESCTALNQRAAKPAEKRRNRLIAGAVLLTATSIALWTYLSAPKPAEDIFNENYTPPQSILEDKAERAARDSVAGTVPEVCEQVLEDADVYFKEKKWEEVIGTLILMADNENDVCKSDALFYMAIAGLQLENPELTLECLSKISDIDRYGEDLYWYQALAFVKIAAERPGKRSLARKAVERARSNTVIPERKVQAEKMLSELGD